jgi:hypothetical protein
MVWREASWFSAKHSGNTSRRLMSPLVGGTTWKDLVCPREALGSKVGDRGRRHRGGIRGSSSSQIEIGQGGDLGDGHLGGVVHLDRGLLLAAKRRRGGKGDVTKGSLFTSTEGFSLRPSGAEEALEASLVEEDVLLMTTEEDVLERTGMPEDLVGGGFLKRPATPEAIALGESSVGEEDFFLLTAEGTLGEEPSPAEEVDGAFVPILEHDEDEEEPPSCFLLPPAIAGGQLSRTSWVEGDGVRRGKTSGIRAMGRDGGRDMVHRVHWVFTHPGVVLSPLGGVHDPRLGGLFTSGSSAQPAR